MTRGRFQRVKELFDRVVDLPEEERAAFLERECADDPELRTEVEELLKQETGGSALRGIERAAEHVHRAQVQDATATEPPPSEGTSTTIGPYRLLEKIGEGGMGEVWAAEQQEPVRRRVALKVIKRGMDTKQVIARFEAERQALALMDHPAIAKVFEAGETPRGRPYFVMEYVEGVAITEHCDRQRLTTKERLELFRQVCEGVQHAHHKAIIHRDLKPSNVLVSIQDGKAVPKIIDFGVAKAIAQRLTEHTVYTELGVLIGTPEYMSPEQAEMTGQSVDTRTDVYSLGVMLYELLVGALPFDSIELRMAGFDEIRRKIREEDPPRPSTRVSSLPGEASTQSAKNRSTESPTLSRQLRGDLDWITMKALEKTRARRYASPNEFAADIERYLSNEPIAARPPSRIYQLRKFAARNRVLVGGVAATFLALVAGIVTSTVEWMSADRAKSDLETVVEFQSSMLTDIDPEDTGYRLFQELRKRVDEAQTRRGASGEEVEAAKASLNTALAGVNATDLARWVLDENVLSPAADAIEKEFTDQPLIEARLRHTVGNTYLGLVLYDNAESHLLQAVEIRERELGRDHPDTLTSLRRLGNLRFSQGRYDESDRYNREVLEGRRRVLGNDHPDTLESISSVGELLETLGQFDEAESYLREALEGRRRVLGNDHPDTLESIFGMARLLSSQGKLDAAEVRWREALEGRRRVLGNDNVHTLATIKLMGDLFYQQGRRDEAEALYREALEGHRRVLGDDHPNTLISIRTMGDLLSGQGKLDEAEALYREALEGHRRVLGDDHRSTLISIAVMGKLRHDQGRMSEAETYWREALEGRRRVLGDDHYDTLSSFNNMGYLFWSQGKLDEAEPYWREALEGRRRVFGDDHSETLISINNMAALLQNQGKLDEAGTYYRESLEGCRRKLGDDHPLTLSSILNVGYLLMTLGRLDEAEAYYRESLEGSRRVRGDDHPSTLFSINSMGYLLQAQGRLPEAEAHFREALEGCRRVLGDGHPTMAGPLGGLGSLRIAQRRFAEAEELLREALEIRRKTLTAGHWRIGQTMSHLGESLTGQGRFEEAEPLVLGGHEIMEASPTPTAKQKREAIERIVALYVAWGRSDKAAEWRAWPPHDQNGQSRR